MTAPFFLLGVKSSYHPVPSTDPKSTSSLSATGLYTHKSGYLLSLVQPPSQEKPLLFMIYQNSFSGRWQLQMPVGFTLFEYILESSLWHTGGPCLLVDLRG